MKNILFVLLMALSFISKAQGIDSSKIMIKPVTMQARDWEFIYPVMGRGDEVYEDLYDQIKDKYKTGIPGTLQNVTIDSIRTDVLISLYTWMMMSNHGNVDNFYTRVSAVIKALPYPYLQRRVAEIDAAYIQYGIEVRTEARRRYRKQRL